MDLFAEEERKIRQKPKKDIKPTTILLAFIMILSIVTVIIFCLLIYIKGNILHIMLNGVENEELKQVLIINEGKVQVPIKSIAKYLGYEAHSGDYETLAVDATKSYVENDNQVTMFTANSKIIKQILLESNSVQEITIDEEIIERDGEFYTTIEGAKKIFDIYFTYDQSKNNIVIMTLEVLYNNDLNYYMQHGYVKIEETFQNKKALLENMMILKNKSEKYGVMNVATGQMILENQYDAIQYIPKLSSFLVTGNKQKGVISKDKKMILDIEYKDIKIIENQKENESYYLVTTNNNLMGLMSTDGEIIIYPEYNKFGIDNSSNYKDNDINNEYILFNKIIPVKQNNLWAIFNIQGEQITEFQYTNLGCTTKLANTYNVIQIPEYELIVVNTENQKYNLITTDGRELFDDEIELVYKTVSSGKEYYYVVSNEKTIELISYLKQNGIKKVKD